MRPRGAKGLPDHVLLVREYDEMRQLAKAFADNHHELMVIVGDGGIGKSEIVRRVMQESHGGKGWKLIKGKHSPLDLYRNLYNARLVPIVLDDLDALLKNHDNTAILKCVCDSVPVRRVEWGSMHAAFSSSQSTLPTSFETISRVCIIINEWESLNRNVTALQDRGVVVFFRPSAVEVHKEIACAGWFDDLEVFNFIAKNLFLVTRPSFRMYITGKNHRRSGLEWRDLLLRTIEGDIEPKMILVARLLADSHYDKLKAPERARERAFKRLGGGSRATYHRYKCELLERRGEFDPALVERITLAPVQHDPLISAIQDRREQLEAMRNESQRPVAEREENLRATPGNVLSSRRTKGGSQERSLIVELRREMEKATGVENYELAAKLRDLIQDLGEADTDAGKET